MVVFPEYFLIPSEFSIGEAVIVKSDPQRTYVVEAVLFERTEAGVGLLYRVACVYYSNRFTHLVSPAELDSILPPTSAEPATTAASYSSADIFVDHQAAS